MKYIPIILLLNLFCTLKIQAKFNKKEISTVGISFLLKQENDSLISKKVKKIDKLYKEAEYSNSLIEAFALLKLDIDTETRFNINFLIAEIYRKNNNHTTAIIYYKNALASIKNNNKFTEKYNDQVLKETNVLKIYLRLGGEFLRDKQKDSAKFYYNKVFTFNSLDDLVLSYQASASSNLSGIYMQDTLYDLAKTYAKNAIELHRKRNNKISEATALGNLAGIYLEQEDFNKAKETYIEALLLIEHETSDRAKAVKQNLYLNFAYNLYKLEDYQAYIYQEKSYKLKDNLRDKEIRKIIEELNYEYNFNNKKELFEKEVENERLKAQNLFSIVGVIALIIIISLVYWVNLFKLRKNNLALKLQRTEMLQNQKLEKLKAETHNRILNAAIDSKEAERKEIAETLHDNVSALLSSANLHLQASRKHFNNNTPVEIDKAQQIIVEASTKVRDLSHTLMPSVLVKFGLNFAVKDIAEKFSNSELKIETDIQHFGRFEQNFEIKIYNIILELVNNILKHSEANKAFIKIEKEDKKLFIEILDNGVGFDKTKMNLKVSLGINQIDARIDKMKGVFRIDTAKNKGTKIFIEVPVLEKEVLNHA